ncbi:MAG: glycoside hydrolase family 3 protein [Jiangellaceae bacterium]
MDGSLDPARLRGLALATLFPGFVGTTAPPPWLAALVREGLGGVVLFGRNVDPRRGDEGVLALTKRLRTERADLLVAIDEEGGDVTRLDATTGSDLPGSAALGVVDDPALTRQVAASLGARLRACGVDVNFAPVADVDVDPLNPIVGVRAFGADPRLVARQVGAFVAGQQSWQVAATAKHFPGHGATDEDSHLTVPTVSTPAHVLRQRELVPFRAAVAAGVKIVMTAHIKVTAIDPDAPATLSRPVITGLLRDELGFDGVVMTDGMDMHAISRTVGHAEAGVLALLAGVDALCVGGESTDARTVEGIATALVAAVRSGRLPHDRLFGAARRVRSLARWARQAPASTGDGPGEPPGVRAARRAVVAVGDVALEAAPVVLELQDEPSVAAGDVPWGIGAPLARRLPGTVIVPLHESGPVPASVLAAHDGRPVVVSVRGVRRRAWQAATVAAIREIRPDVVVVDHDLPADPGVLGQRYVLAFGAARVTAEAAADLLAALAVAPDPEPAAGWGSTAPPVSA